MIYYPFLIAWLVIYFTPAQHMIQKLPSAIVDFLTCFKCLSFWLTFFCTFDLINAILAALLATVYDKYINS